MVECKICNREFRNNSGLGRHIKLTHKISSKEYYDTYLKKITEGTCKICGSSTNFRNWSVGYSTYCSTKCANLDEEIQNKSKETSYRKTGYTHNTLNPNNKSKVEKTCLERYGVPHYTKTKEYIDKTKATCLNKYGTEYSFQSDNNKIKTKATCLEKYGVDNPSKSTIIKNKISIKNNKYKKEQFLKILPQGYKLLKYEVGDIVELECPKHHTFKCQKQLIVKRRKAGHEFCTICSPLNSFLNSTSIYEKELIEFIKENINDVQSNNREIIKPLELDVYVPDLKLAFEFNGLYWHSELYKDEHYHLNKTKECIKKGIHLVHIYEDDWIYKKDIVKSRILNLLGKSKRIYARKCTIKTVDIITTKQFLENNHIQGSINSKYNIGLYYNNELVSLMTFGTSRFEKDKIELTRFCNKLDTTVIGGASRLFKYATMVYNFKEVISYADRSWSNGGLYWALGFKLIKETEPNYYYVQNGIRENRFKYRKAELIKEGFDSNKTEKEIMFDREIYRIYDSGSLKFINTSI